MKEKIYTGSSKTLYQADEDYALIMSFNDTLKLQDKSSIVISGKGAINNSISAFLMQKLELIGVETHFIQKNNMRQQLIQFVDVYPVQVHVSSLASGRYVTDFGMEDGFVFDSPIIDFRVKNGDLNYPIINEHQIYSFSWLSKKEIKNLKFKWWSFPFCRRLQDEKRDLPSRPRTRTGGILCRIFRSLFECS
jgi:phosphoribosylaminoimidazole-succinocarboxamide synthase